MALLLTRRALLTGALACLLAPPEILAEPRRKLWALGGLRGIEGYRLSIEVGRLGGIVFTRTYVIQAAQPGLWKIDGRFGDAPSAGDRFILT